MKQEIRLLLPREFERCAELWNMKKQRALADRFYSELQSGNRVTWICEQNEMLLGEISLVFNMAESDYTIAHKRAYVSHLVVKKEHRRKGIGSALVAYIIEQAKQMGLQELTIGVNLDGQLKASAADLVLASAQKVPGPDAFAAKRQHRLPAG